MIVLHVCYCWNMYQWKLYFVHRDEGVRYYPSFGVPEEVSNQGNITHTG